MLWWGTWQHLFASLSLASRRTFRLVSSFLRRIWWSEKRRKRWATKPWWPSFRRRLPFLLEWQEFELLRWQLLRMHFEWWSHQWTLVKFLWPRQPWLLLMWIVMTTTIWSSNRWEENHHQFLEFFGILEDFSMYLNFNVVSMNYGGWRAKSPMRFSRISG